jgi:hypothetical protein
MVIDLTPNLLPDMVLTVELGMRPNPEECRLFQISTVGYLVFVVLKFLPGRSSSFIELSFPRVTSQVSGQVTFEWHVEVAWRFRIGQPVALLTCHNASSTCENQKYVS